MTSHILSHRSNSLRCKVVRNEAEGAVINEENKKLQPNYNMKQANNISRGVSSRRLSGMNPLQNKKIDDKSKRSSLTGDGSTSSEAAPQLCLAGEVASKENLRQSESLLNHKNNDNSHGRSLRRYKFHLSPKDAEVSLKTIYTSKAFKDFASNTNVVNVGHFNLQNVFPQVRDRNIRYQWSEGRGSFGAVYCVTVTCPCCYGFAKLEHGKLIPVHYYGGVQSGMAPHYVMKKIPQNFIDQHNGVKYARERSRDSEQKFSQAVTDLLLEAHILASLNHPNIISVKGAATVETKAQDFFFLMERLRCNLSHRIHHNWAKKQAINAQDSDFWSKSKLPTRINTFFRNSAVRRLEKLWVERISVARDIASALAYMHERRVVHRDIKPKNIGFALDYAVKLFDFGTAVQIPSNDPECYVRSGRVGSRRYMAPEVFARKPYNEAADVYSFVLVLWEMLTFEKPVDWNAELTSSEEELIAGEVGEENTASTRSKSLLPERTIPSRERISIPVEWSQGIGSALSLGWSFNPRDRLTAASFVVVFETELNRHKLAKRASSQ